MLGMKIKYFASNMNYFNIPFPIFHIFIIPNDLFKFALLWKLKHMVSGATLGITDKMEAWPQLPLLVPQARAWDEGVRPCDSDLFFPLFG